MKLIKGENLNKRQREQVTRAFGYRWTNQNLRHATWAYEYANLALPYMEPISDDKWIQEHAFYFLNDGSRMAANRHHAVPECLA